MAKSSRSILFLAAIHETARAAAAAFTAVSSRLGLSWTVEAAAVASVDPIRLAEFTVVAAVEAPEFTPPVGVRLERLSTSPDLEQSVSALLARLFGGSDAAPAPRKTPPPPAPRKVHTVKLSRETAGRKGKGVTVVSELPLGEDALKELATLLKNKCGTGGTAKDGRIEIQGDHRDKLAVELEKLGYKVKRAGG